MSSAYLDPGKVLNLRIDGVFGETLVLMMDALGICISAGSACRSHEAAPSHVLIAHGLTATEARSSVRISFSKFNTADEVAQAAAVMAGCIETLRSSQEVPQDGTD
jgi:cysteine desulfurase